MKSETAQPTDLAHVAWLEQILEPGYSLTHTRHGWYLKRWTSWASQHHDGDPRLCWLDVDSDPRLEALLERITHA